MYARNLVKQTASVVSTLAKTLNVVRRGLVMLAQNPPLVFAILASYQAILAQAQILSADDVVGYWPMEGNALDISGNNNHGKEHLITYVEDHFGNQNKAAYFFGDQSYIDGNSTGLPQGTKSVSVWVLPNHREDTPNKGREGWIFGYGGAPGVTSGKSFILGINNIYTVPNSYEVQSHFKTNIVTYVDSEMSNIPLGKWTHIGVTTAPYIGTKIYINGELVVHEPNAFVGNTAVDGAKFTIGCLVWPDGQTIFNSQWWHGAISKLLITSNVITSKQMSDIASATQNTTLFTLPVETLPVDEDENVEDNFEHSTASKVLATATGVGGGALVVYSIFRGASYYREKRHTQNIGTPEYTQRLMDGFNADAPDEQKQQGPAV